MPITKTRSRTSTTAETVVDDESIPSNRPSDEEIKATDKTAEDILDEIDRVLDESAVARDEAKRALLNDDLLDEIDSILEQDVAVTFLQSGGE